MYLRAALLLVELAHQQPKVVIRGPIDGANTIVTQYSERAVTIIDTLPPQIQNSLSSAIAKNFDNSNYHIGFEGFLTTPATPEGAI